MNVWVKYLTHLNPAAKTYRFVWPNYIEFDTMIKIKLYKVNIDVP